LKCRLGKDQGSDAIPSQISANHLRGNPRHWAVMPQRRPYALPPGQPEPDCAVEARCRHGDAIRVKGSTRDLSLVATKLRVVVPPLGPAHILSKVLPLAPSIQVPHHRDPVCRAACQEGSPPAPHQLLDVVPVRCEGCHLFAAQAREKVGSRVSEGGGE